MVWIWIKARITVEKWTPNLMPRPDRHNEIEINLLTGGSMIYLFDDRKILIPSERLSVLMEICARLNRFALNSMPAEWDEYMEGDHDLFTIDLVEKMIIFIARNYTQPIKNEDIGKAVGLHPDYANTVFKKSFGKTLNQYLNLQRILHAQRQLSVSKDSITKIAYDAGFNSISRFNAAFRQKCNCCPREYRKRRINK